MVLLRRKGRGNREGKRGREEEREQEKISRKRIILPVSGNVGGWTAPVAKINNDN